MLDFNKLAVCGKETFTDGEKQEFSGVMNQWYKQGKYYYFLYRQPIIYHPENLDEKQRYSKSKKELELICKEEGYFRYPIHAYMQRILVARIIEWSDSMGLSFLSGDDDIGYSFKFPHDDLGKVKIFFENNFREIDFGGRIMEFMGDNNFEYW